MLRFALLRADMCEAQSRIESKVRTGRRKKSKTSAFVSRHMPWTLHLGASELSYGRRREIG